MKTISIPSAMQPVKLVNELNHRPDHQVIPEDIYQDDIIMILPPDHLIQPVLALGFGLDTVVRSYPGYCGLVKRSK